MSTRPEPAPRELARAGGTGRLRRLAPACALALAGCASSPGILTDTDDRDSRSVLAERADAGKIRTVVYGNPFDMDPSRLDALVTRAMAAGVSGLSPQFTVHPTEAGTPEPHLVVVLNPLGGSAAQACRAPQSMPTASAARTTEMQILAAFCQGSEPLGSARSEGAVASPTDRRFERLLWRTSSALFPDDYWETYGFGILPRDLDLGIGGSIGLD